MASCSFCNTSAESVYSVGPAAICPECNLHCRNVMNGWTGPAFIKKAVGPAARCSFCASANQDNMAGTQSSRICDACVQQAARYFMASGAATIVAALVGKGVEKYLNARVRKEMTPHVDHLLQLPADRGYGMVEYYAKAFKEDHQWNGFVMCLRERATATPPNPHAMVLVGIAESCRPAS